MRNRSGRRTRVALMTAAVGLLATGAALPSAPLPVPGLPETTAAPKSRLWLSVVRGENPDAADRDWAVLTCGPDGGTHSRARAACKGITNAEGNLAALPIAERVCAKIYAPVTVEAMGRWRGKLVEYRRTYPNDCMRQASTGDVFAFANR